MSFASEFRKKYFLDPLNEAKGAEREKAIRPRRKGDQADQVADSVSAPPQSSERVATGGDAVEAAPAARATSTVFGPPGPPHMQQADTEPGPGAHEAERVYRHEVIASRPQVDAAETRANFHRMLAAMLIATALLAVLHSGALATYARGLPYSKVSERIIMAAEVWHGAMEQTGLTGVMTTARNWVTAIRESRWSDLGGLVGLEGAPGLDRGVAPLEEGSDLGAEMPLRDANTDAVDDIEAGRPDIPIRPQDTRRPLAKPAETQR